MVRGGQARRAPVEAGKRGRGEAPDAPAMQNVRASRGLPSAGREARTPTGCDPQRILSALRLIVTILLAIPPLQRSHCVRLCVSFGQAVGVVDAFCWPKDCATVHGEPTRKTVRRGVALPNGESSPPRSPPRVPSSAAGVAEFLNPVRSSPTPRGGQPLQGTASREPPKAAPGAVGGAACERTTPLA